MKAGDHLALRIEKPVAGGRMLARHAGAVVLVSGAIPGELIDAEIEKVQRGTAWARTVRVTEPAEDRIDAVDTACGGNLLAHVRYPRQLSLKRDIILDTFARIGRVPLDFDIPVTESPTEGYRMRARLHVVNGRLGFYREGTHQLCDMSATRQLLPATITAVQRLEKALRPVVDDVVEVEVAENRLADQRAVHLILRDSTNPTRVDRLLTVDDVTGVSCGRASGGKSVVVWGTPEVSDTLVVPTPAGPGAVTLTRQAHAFFQGNRYLLGPLLDAVTDAVPPGRVLDLYAGVGLFSVALGQRGDTEVIAIEGDRTSASDLKFNATRAGSPIEVRRQSVEAFLATRRVPALGTVILDPPRTGVSKDALRGTVALRAPQIVYLSCDVATLARDTRVLLDAGYQLNSLRAFDLFPNTAHIETLAVFAR